MKDQPVKRYVVQHTGNSRYTEDDIGRNPEWTRKTVLEWISSSRRRLRL